MAARLQKQPEKRIVSNYADDLESFWHTLLYVTLQRCEHVYDPEKVASVLNRLFEYNLWHGRMIGGDSKRYELKTRMALEEMGICNRPLFYVLQQSAEILAARYPADERANVEEITRLKQEYKGDDFSAHFFTKVCRVELYGNYADWEALKKLEMPGWMEGVFDAVLENDEYDWDRGGGNVERSLPTLEGSNWNDRRHLNPRYFLW